jgi:predicted kinase
MKSKKIRVNVGVPGSGKTTESLDFIRKNPGWCRISRDDIRFMLKGSYSLDYAEENLVTKVFFQAAKNSLLSGFNVILDATHCSYKSIESVIEELGHLGDVEFRIFDVPLKTCIERDSQREPLLRVGEERITEIHKSLVDFLQSYPLGNLKRKEKVIKNYTKEWDSSLPFAVIFDIDGTLAHMGNKRSPFDWDKVYLDELDSIIAHQVELHRKAGDKIIILSGRDGSCKKITEEWLEIHGIKYDEFYIRPEKDTRKDSVIKKEIYEAEIKGKFNIRLVYDDRNQVVDMWRKLGLKCLQVEPGEF